MSAQWLSHFSLKESPFSKELDDDDLWVPGSRKTIVDELVAATEARGHILLTGEPGVGKTCVLRALRQRLPEAGFRLTYCHNVTLGRRDFYRQLCHALGLSPKATAAGVFYEVSQHVQDMVEQRVHPAFLLDEAHLLHQDVLDHLHILANYDWDSKALLSLVLVGLPELDDRMRLRRNRSLWSRIHTRLHLGDATPEDTAGYIAHRIGKAGVRKTLFNENALSRIHESTTGRLRDIDRLATFALKRAARREAERVGVEEVERAIAAD
jgi:type II secretory pathway predicted ATPase ExeA